MMPSRAAAHTAERTRGRGVMPWMLVALAVGAIWSARAWPFLVDDAFIVARYAERLAEGAYGFQPGPATDGVTGPLWLLPGVLAVLCGASPVLAAKVFGLTCALGAASLVVRAAARGAGGRMRAMWVALFLATSAPLWVWAIGGLETGLATLLASALMLAARARPYPRPWLAGACGAGLSWLRPELAIWVSFALVMLWMRSRRGALTALALAALGAALLLLFRWSTFHHLLPLSARAKAPSLGHGVQYALTCLRAPGALGIAPLLVWGAWRGGRRERELIVALLLHALAVVLAGGDWMQGARLFVPVAPCACLVAAEALVRVGRRSPRWVLALALVSLGLRSLGVYTESSAARASGLLREARLPALLEALEAVEGPIALIDIGAVGYFGKRPLLDLGGLIEPNIAHAPGGHLAKRIDPSWLRAQAPGAFVLHSRVAPRVDGAGHVRWFAGYPVERWVLAQPWVLAEYRVSRVVPYASDYFYLVLKRDQARP